MSVIECSVSREEMMNTDRSTNEVLKDKGFKFNGRVPLGEITYQDDFCTALRHYKQVIKDGR